MRILMIAAGLLSLASVAPLAGAADIAAGKIKSAACGVCHGQLGLSSIPNAPSLAGQPEIYLAEQLKNYRSGKRQHEVMGVIAKPLTDQDKGGNRTKSIIFSASSISSGCRSTKRAAP